MKARRAVPASIIKPIDIAARFSNHAAEWRAQPEGNFPCGDLGLASPGGIVSGGYMMEIVNFTGRRAPEYWEYGNESDRL